MSKPNPRTLEFKVPNTGIIVLVDQWDPGTPISILDAGEYSELGELPPLTRDHVDQLITTLNEALRHAS